MKVEQFFWILVCDSIKEENDWDKGHAEETRVQCLSYNQFVGSKICYHEQQYIPVATCEKNNVDKTFS